MKPMSSNPSKQWKRNWKKTEKKVTILTWSINIIGGVISQIENYYRDRMRRPLSKCPFQGPQPFLKITPNGYIHLLCLSLHFFSLNFHCYQCFFFPRKQTPWRFCNGEWGKLMCTWKLEWFVKGLLNMSKRA